MKEISLALGGGGARGLAHIGVLRVLEREGFRVRAVAGTSMGGVIGAAYASTGSVDEVQRLMEQGLQQELFRARPDGDGLIGIRSVEATLRNTLQGKTFADLLLPFAVTATDLETGSEVVIDQGDVVSAVLATIALPGIFPPQEVKGHPVVDGGVVDPVPVRTARRLYPGVVVASVLSPPREQWANNPSPSPLPVSQVFSFVYRFRPGRALKVFLRSMEISARNFTELRLESDSPDIIIRPQVAHIGLLDTPSVAEVALIGEQAARDVLPGLQAQFTALRRFARWLGWRKKG